MPNCIIICSEREARLILIGVLQNLTSYIHLSIVCVFASSLLLNLCVLWLQVITFDGYTISIIPSFLVPVRKRKKSKYCMI